MNDAAADKYIEMYYGAIHANILAEHDDMIKRTLRLLIKEVERDTRHKCADIASNAANEIHNLQH